MKGAAVSVALFDKIRNARITIADCRRNSMTKLSLRSFEEIEDRIETNQEITYFVELKNRPSCCPYCESDLKMYSMGQGKARWIKDVPQRNKKVKLCVYQRRYQCSDCGVQFWERLPDVHPTKRMTKRLAKLAVKEAKQNLVIATAKKLGVCDGTIRQLCRAAMTDKAYKDLMERGFQTSGKRKPKD